LDNESIQRWPNWMEFSIQVKTVKVVIWRDGAY
jgi:lipopolysaccharide/colanic/teichoic acid biosynthesis glycosyltransferase